MICNKTFGYTDSLAAHVRLHYSHLKHFTCPKHSAVCLTEKDLQVHISQEHFQSTEYMARCKFGRL